MTYLLRISRSDRHVNQEAPAFHGNLFRLVPLMAKARTSDDGRGGAARRKESVPPVASANEGSLEHRAPRLFDAAQNNPLESENARRV